MKAKLLHFSGTWLLLGALAAVASAEPVVIAHKGLARETFDAASVKAVFLGKKVAWDTGGRVTLAALKKGEVADEFLTKYAGVNASAFGNQWRRLAMTGGGIAPKTFDDEAALRAFVASTEGAVGFVDRANADDSVLVLTP